MTKITGERSIMAKTSLESSGLQSQQVRRGGGVAHVYETLRNEIIELKLAPGSPIDETELSERFAMSRTPIREALVRLAAEGLITALTNRTTIVSNIDFVQLGAFPFVEMFELFLTRGKQI